MIVVAFSIFSIVAVLLAIATQYAFRKLEEHERDIIRLDDETRDIRDTIENLYTEFVGKNRHE